MSTSTMPSPVTDPRAHALRARYHEFFAGEELPVPVERGLDFLFSRNRLNVAISRAKCLAYLVASPRLLDANCRTVEQMRLANALCRFVEKANRGVVRRVD